MTSARELLEPLRILIESQQSRISALEAINTAQAKEIDDLCDHVFELQQMLSRAVEA